MNILTINTSNQALGVGLLQDGQIIGEVITNLVKNHSVRLMPAIDHVMKEVGIEPAQLDKIVVAKGPGSYTGVRIGIITAKSLAWALDIPVVGVSSLEVLAYQGRFYDSYICPFFDARRQSVFTSLYQWENNELRTIYDEENVLMQEWLTKVKKDDKSILFLSPDLELHKKMIIEHVGDKAIFPESPYHIAQPSHLALIGMEKTPKHTHLLVPNYLRLSEAEANWIKSTKVKS